VRGKAAAPVTSVERQRWEPIPSAEKVLVAAALQGRLGGHVVERIHEGYFEEPACKTLFSIIKNDLIAGNPIDFGDIATHLRGEAELTLLSELTLTEDIEDQSLSRIIDQNLPQMERAYTARRRQEITTEIQEASRKGDGERVDVLMRMWKELK
jgi:replicative DNA helicase